MLQQPKLLCILHRSPPAHGAAKVGDFIASSKKLNESFECHYITIKSSNDIGDIGKVNFKKFYLVAELYIKVLWALLTFRPQKIYFTASIRSVALYRDLLVSTLWKAYGRFKPISVFYHYHTKGVDEFISDSERNLKLTRFFVKDVNLVLLSPVLEKDFEKVHTFKNIFYLPNGVENTLKDIDFSERIEIKYKQKGSLEVLYLSNMIKSKGYFSVLELANQTKDQPIKYHFAGGWQNSEDVKEFFDYIEQNKLAEKVIFHGFVNGDEKRKLFEKAHFFIFPTRYKNEAFPLSILEALSYGVPAIATDEGSIPYILDKESGIILHNVHKLPEVLETAIEKFVNVKTSKYCRERYLKYFTLKQFEENLVEVLEGDPCANSNHSGA